MFTMPYSAGVLLRQADLLCAESFRPLTARLHATQPHQALERVFVEPRLRALRAIAGQQVTNLCPDMLRAQLHISIRRCEIAIPFRNLILQYQVIAKRVPGQLADEAVVLMSVVAPVSEHQVRPRRTLERLEALLDRRVLGRKVAVAKRVNNDLGALRTAQKAPGTRAHLFRPFGRCGKRNPAHSTAGILEKLQQRAAAAYVNVVAMSSQTQNAQGPRPAPAAKFQFKHDEPAPNGASRFAAAPDHPWAGSLCLHSVESKLVLERIHRLPEPRVSIGRQQALRDQTLERLHDELLTLLYIVKDLPAQNEVPAVEPPFALIQSPELLDKPGAIGCDDMKGLRTSDRSKAGHDVLFLEIPDHLVQRQVRYAIRIVGQKHRLALQILADPTQTLSDVTVQTRIDEGDSPVIEVAGEKFYVVTAA